MRRRGFVGCPSCKILGGCHSAKGLVGSKCVEFVGEGIEPWVEVLKVVGLDLVEEEVGVVSGGAAIGLSAGPLGNRAVNCLTVG